MTRPKGMSSTLILCPLLPTYGYSKRTILTDFFPFSTILQWICFLDDRLLFLFSFFFNPKPLAGSLSGWIFLTSRSTLELTAGKVIRISTVILWSQMDRLIEPHILAFFTQTYTPSVLKYKGFKSVLSQIVLSLTKKIRKKD